MDLRSGLSRGDRHQVQVAFCEALELEGLLGDLIDARAVGLADRSVDDGVVPILRAVSDNGPQMTWGSTCEFMAMCAIAHTSDGPAPRLTRLARNERIRRQLRFRAADSVNRHLVVECVEYVSQGGHRATSITWRGSPA